MKHTEDRSFEIRLHLVARFDESYEGDDDGFSWHERFDRELRPRLVAAVFDVLRAHPRFRALPAPRGRDPQTAIDVEVEFLPEGAQGAAAAGDG